MDTFATCSSCLCRLLHHPLLAAKRRQSRFCHESDVLIANHPYCSDFRCRQLSSNQKSTKILIGANKTSDIYVNNFYLDLSKLQSNDCIRKDAQHIVSKLLQRKMNEVFHQS